MEEYIVSARKYRPLNFDSVVGQRGLTTTLKNSITTGKLAHAYLFCGPRGVGKTTCARIFAKAINCTSPREGGDACGECESCRAFDEQRSMNIHELDAASNNSVEDIRELCKQVLIPPQTGRYKVFIIDEVHMLSSAAFNAFLKTLEEPPSYVVFILATTEKHKILPTILSRCQVYDFQRMTMQDTVDHLKHVAAKEGYSADAEALTLIAEKADGGMRDALSIFDQMVSFTGGNLTYEKVCENLNVLSTKYYFRLVDHFLKNEVEPCMLLFNEVLMKGFDAGNFVAGLSTHLRNLLVSRDEQTLPLLDMSENMKASYVEQAKRCQPKFIYRALKLCNDCAQTYRTSYNKRLQVEICLIQAAQLTEDDDGSGGRCPTVTIKPIFNKLSQQNNTSTVNSEKTPATVSVSPTPPSSPAPAAIHTDGSSKEDKVKKPILKKVSFKHFGNTQEAEKEDAKTADALPQAHVETPLEEDSLRRAWLAYCASLPKEQTASVQRMKGITPVITGTSTFEITVNNQVVQHQMQHDYDDIVKFLREKLNNTELSFTVKLADIQEVQVMYSKPEHLKALETRNPSVKELMETLGLMLD